MHSDFILNSHFKSYPGSAAPCKASELVGKRWNILADDLPYPIAIIHRSALQHNLAWMQNYAKRKGVVLAPHGKTTMSAQIFQMQLDAGAWGISFATLHQVCIGVASGVRRIIIANQVVCDADLETLSALLASHTDLRIWFLVDSLDQLGLIEEWTKRRQCASAFDVLLEIGIPGQRTGCRTYEDALHLARRISASPALRLCGVECYEGGVATCRSDDDVREVSAVVRRVMQIVKVCDEERLFESDEVLLSAGGSAVFDLVLPLLQMQSLNRAVQGVLRSGCYVTHDHGSYARFSKLVEQREGLDQSLQAAIEVWTMVQSVPEPGLALLSGGRRDLSFDIEMPLPQRIARRGDLHASKTPLDWKISALNDQHAYLRFDPKGPVPKVGDRVALGISHPCTTFDKWSWMPLVDEALNVTGAIGTQF